MNKKTLNTKEFLSNLAPGQMLETLFESIPDVLYFVKNRQHQFVTCNLLFAKSFGLDCIEDVLGQTDLDFSADFLAKSYFEDDNWVMDNARAIINRIELVPTAGTLDWLSTTKTPLYDKNQKIVGLAGIARSISDSDDIYQNNPEMRTIIDHIKEHYRKKITISTLSEISDLSKSSVERLFSKTFGVKPGIYIRKIRLNETCRHLRESDRSLKDIATSCGFTDQTSMTRAFSNTLRITPRSYRMRFNSKHNTK